MNSNTVSLLVFASVFGSTVAAMWLRKAIPSHHLSDATKDTVKVAMGLVATMAALVLGLLVASTKGTYDTEKNEVIQIAAKITYLDRVLAGYGPETAGPREMLRHALEGAIKRLWPDEKSQPAQTDFSSQPGEALRDSIQKLSPQNDAQRAAKDEAAHLAADLGQMRWLLFEQLETSISLPMLLVVVCWLAILFFSFGLFCPGNATAIGALLVAALSVSGAIFLILELDHPFDGFIQISSGPMRTALSHLGR